MHFWHAWGAWVVAGVLAAIAIAFLFHFVLPAIALGRDLVRANNLLAGFTPPVAPERIAAEAMATPRLSPLWREYAHTLHAAGDPRQAGGPAAWRATAMAEDFFTERALVDTPLKTEFYKHLPGILTGIGIIGTFTGLIAGLSHFEVSGNAEAVRTSLHSLIQGVGQAFEVSAAAITLAMLATWIEKSTLTRRYRQVERLNQLIDGLFDAGVEEEYLARLVRASEASAVQAARLQQAIVGELRQSMEALLAQQAEASRRQQEAFAARIAEAVAGTVGSTLKEPLGRMTAALEKLGSGQGQALGGAVGQALERFNQHLDATFGQRQDGLEALLRQTAMALEAAVEQLGKVAQRLEQAGRGAVESAAGRLDLAGRGVGDAAEAFAMTSTDMSAAAAAMSAAAKATAQALAEQNQASAGIARQLADLRATVEVARREAALTGELVGRMERAANSLGQAGEHADAYLQGVSRVLGEAHAAFAENVERTLAQGNGQFQLHVAAAVEALKGAIEELGDALAENPARR